MSALPGRLPRVLSTRPNPGNGYLLVGLHHHRRQTTRTVHSLVAEAFIGPRPAGQQIRHLDGDPVNNHLGNLRYGTGAENARDQVRHGTHANGTKTHCPQGHRYDEANTYVIPSTGGRACRACNKASGAERTRRYRARRAAEAHGLTVT
jgi:hypothetical protein